MRKISGLILFLLVLIIGVGVYYFYFNTQKSNVATLRSIEQCVPNDAELVLKIDLKKHKFTLLKEMLTFDYASKDSSLSIDNSLVEFAKEVMKKAGGGIALFEPVYLYRQADKNWGAFISLADKAAFDSLLHQSNHIILVNDSIASINQSDWKMRLEGSFIHLYSADNVQQGNNTPSWDFTQLNAQPTLISGLIKLKEGMVYSTVDYHQGKWSIHASLPYIADTTTGGRLTKKISNDKDPYLDVFIADAKSPYLGYLSGMSELVNEVISQVKRPMHIQYLGKATKTENYVTYEYNDDFEMVEVVKTQQVEKELVTALFYTSAREEGSQLKKAYAPFFTDFDIQDQLVVASYQPINNLNISSADSLYAQLIIKDFANQIPKQLQELLGKKTINIPFNTFELYAYTTSSEQLINITTTISMKKEYQGMFDLKKLLP